MSLRVIGGEYRGRVLTTVRGFGTRPLLGQVREAVFNVLGQRLDDMVVWDLFAGTGANGIESLSRGARRVWFLDKANQALQVLGRNLQALGEDATRRSVVLKADAWDPPALVPDGMSEEVAPDIVFLDPPYPLVAEDPVRAAYRAQRLVQRLAPGGVLCFHFRDGQLDVDDFDAGLDVDLRVWGTTAFAFVRVRDGD
ncbi:MAG: RsmD family RNA methyltransferase [Planctomycetota bacterium]